MTAQPKSAYLNLYDQESKNASYQFQVENKQAGVSWKDSKTGRPMKFYSDSQWFYKKDGTMGYDARSRHTAAELVGTGNAAAHAVNAIAHAANSVARIAGDAANQGLIEAEATRAGLAEGVNAAAVVAEKARAELAEGVNAASVVSEASARATAVSAEAVLRANAITAVQLQISNILSDATPQVLDDLASIVASFQAADSTLTGALATLQNSFDDLKDRVDELTDPP